MILPGFKEIYLDSLLLLLRLNFLDIPKLEACLRLTPALLRSEDDILNSLASSSSSNLHNSKVQGNYYYY